MSGKKDYVKEQGILDIYKADRSYFCKGFQTGNCCKSVPP